MPGRRGFFFHSLGDLCEVAWIAKVFVDAREADVGDMVERLETRHHRLADRSRRDFVAAGFELALNPAYKLLDLGQRDLPLAGRVTNCTLQLCAVERLALAVLLDDRQVAEL